MQGEVLVELFFTGAISLHKITGGKGKVIGRSCISTDQFRYFLKNIGGPEKGRLLEKKIKDFLLAACVFVIKSVQIVSVSNWSLKIL